MARKSSFFATFRKDSTRAYTTLESLYEHFQNVHDQIEAQPSLLTEAGISRADAAKILRDLKDVVTGLDRAAGGLEGIRYGDYS